MKSQGLSDAQATALRDQAIRNGSISSVQGAAQNAVDENKRQAAEATAKRQQMEAQRAEQKEEQIEALSTPPASPASPSDQLHAYDAIEALRASRTVTSTVTSTNKPWWQSALSAITTSIQNATGAMITPILNGVVAMSRADDNPPPPSNPITNFFQQIGQGINQIGQSINQFGQGINQIGKTIGSWFGGGQSNPTPNATAIFDQAVQTFGVQPTQTAQAKPTTTPASTPTPFNISGQKVVLIAGQLKDQYNQNGQFPNLLHLNDPANTNCTIFVNTVLQEAGIKIPGLSPGLYNDFAKVGPSQQAYSKQNGEIRFVFNNNGIMPDNTTQAKILNAIKSYNNSFVPGSAIYIKGAEYQDASALQITGENRLPYNQHSDFDHSAILVNSDGQIEEMSGSFYWMQSNGRYVGQLNNSPQNSYDYTWNINPNDPKDLIMTRQFFDASTPSETMVKVEGVLKTPYTQDYIVKRITTAVSIVPAQPITTFGDLQNYGLNPGPAKWQGIVLDGKPCYLNLDTKGNIVQQYYCPPDLSPATAPAP